MKFHEVSYRYDLAQATADIELTNKCNLHCSFCPRDQIPRTGFMSRETFYAAIDRLAESPVPFRASSCGTGDSLLHPALAEFISYASHRGLPFRLTTSGTLLTHERSRELIDAGLAEMFFSVSGIGKSYDLHYGHNFENTLENIRRFRESSARSRRPCQLSILIVQTSDILPQLGEIRAFWANEGFSRQQIFLLEEHNRAGSLRKPTSSTRPDHTIATDHMTCENPATGFWCPAPFLSMFIGWDGQYYLCSNDWEKRSGFGSVHDTSFAQALKRKQAYMHLPEKLCNECSYYPENYFATLHPEHSGPPRQHEHTFLCNARHHHQAIHQLLDIIDQHESHSSC